MQTLRTLADLVLLPPGLNLLLTVAGVALLRRRPRTGRVLLWTGLATLLVLAMPIVSSALMHATGSYEAYAGPGTPARAIVVLAGERRAAPEYGGASIGPQTLERLRMGARLARSTGLPLLLSGGRTDGHAAASLAELMQRSLREEFGLQARWIEDESHDTRENAQRSAAILRAAGIDDIILVTHYVHMRRAAADFAAAGIAVRPAPICLPPFEFPGLGEAIWPGAYWPRMETLQESALALHELFAWLVRAVGIDV